MKDLLTHLVLRALAPPTELRARLPSRFEEPAAASGPEAEPAESEWASAPPPEPPPPDAPTRAAEPLRATPIPPSGARTALSARADRQGSHDEAARAPVPRPTAPAHDSPTPAGLAETAAAPAEHRPPARPADDVSRSQEPAGWEAGAPAIGKASAVNHPVRNLSQPKDPTRPPAPNRKAPAGQPLEVHPRKITTAATSPVRTAKPTIAGTAAAASDPPPIQVTIGRIEVRAVPAPAPPPPAMPPAPRLSLDDYLRKGARP
jgi:hypothetical protein